MGMYKEYIEEFDYLDLMAFDLMAYDEDNEEDDEDDESEEGEE
jgi:hypothetical protein